MIRPITILNPLTEGKKYVCMFHEENIKRHQLFSTSYNILNPEGLQRVQEDFQGEAKLRSLHPHGELLFCRKQGHSNPQEDPCKKQKTTK